MTSLPLRYDFLYFLSSGEATYLTSSDGQSDSTDDGLLSLAAGANLSSPLPIGYGDDYVLPVGALATDNIGARTVINMSVAVNPPSLNGINSAVTAQLTNIETAIKDGSVGGASVIIQVRCPLSVSVSVVRFRPQTVVFVEVRFRPQPAVPPSPTSNTTTQASASCVTYAMKLREERLAGGSTDEGSTDSRRAQRRYSRARSLLGSDDGGGGGDDGDDDGDESERQELAELDALRSDLVNLTCAMGQYSATSPEVEQTFVSMVR